MGNVVFFPPVGETFTCAGYYGNCYVAESAVTDTPFSMIIVNSATGLCMVSNGSAIGSGSCFVDLPGNPGLRPAGTAQPTALWTLRPTSYPH